MSSNQSVEIPIGKFHLDGFLNTPEDALGLVLFVHGSGSSRFSVRNQHVSEFLNQNGLATLLFDLFTQDEEIIDERTRELRFDIDFLAARLIKVTEWCLGDNIINNKNICYFGTSTGGAAALVAAAKKSVVVKAVVSRGGRPDLASEFLPEVVAPTLLIVGGLDELVIEMNQTALSQMTCVKKLEIVPGATHLFEEPGMLDRVAVLAKDWFLKHLKKEFDDDASASFTG